MSAKSRSRHSIALPIADDDRIVAMDAPEGGPFDGEMVITCESGRVFTVRRVAKYKRPFKVREVTAKDTK